MRIKVINLRKLWLSLLLLVGATAIAIPGIQEIAATEEDVVEISTVDQLKAFRDAVNSANTYAGKTVKLTADLDLSSESNWTPIGNLVAYPGQSFDGTFDGDGHTISNLTVNDNTPNHAVAGLFGSVVNGTIKNLTVKNVNLTSTHYAGGIVAYTSNGPTIENCKVIGGTIKSTPELIGSSYDNGDKVGGIMGYATAGSTINNCTVEGVTITAYRDMGGIVGYSAGTVTNNTAINVTVTQDLTNGYKDPTPTTIGDIIGRDGGATLSNNIVIKSNPVAQIGETKYETISDAVAAATAGQTIEIFKAGDYTLPNLPNNVTIEGTVDGVVFNHTSAGNVASISNGATFKNVTFNFGNVNYHGFQHAGTINMEGCTLNGKLFSYGDMNFTDCSFNQSNSDYHMWTYSGDVTYTDCTFTNSATGKFINVYNESGATKYTVTATNCKFINQAASSKAALNVKATSGSNVLAYDVIINNCTTEGAFPAENWGDALVVLNSVAQVDDRTASGVDNITVTQDGVLIYPHCVAQIGDAKYPTLQSAVDAAQQMGGAQTINLIDDISGETVTIKEVANFKLTIDGKKDESSNYTVDAVIAVDGLRGNGGSTTNGASVTLQNIAFVKTTATDGIQASHYPHNLTIQDCTYSGSDNDKWFLNASVDGPLYGVTVKNVTVEHARLIYANLAEDAVFQNITATNDVKVGFNVKTSGTALIENCQVTTGKYAFRDYSDAYEGTFTLKENTFISTSEESDEGVIVNRGGAVGTAHVNVESGTYTGHLKVMNNKEGVLAISGGYFSEEFPQEYIAADLVAQGKVCAPATDMEGYYTVGDPHYVAQIGETKYVSLAAAVEAAQAGDVITMIDDDNLSLTAAGSEIVINKPLTITGAVDENGKPKFTIYGSANGALSNSSFNDLFISCSTGTVTISNLKFDGFGNEISSVMGHSPVFIGSSNNNAVIENVYISNLNCEGIHINGGTFTIKDCNIDCSKTTNSIFTKGICVVNAATGSIENTTITGVDCNDANDTSAAIELQGSGDIAISGCTIESETIGIATTPVGELTAGTSQVTVSDCTVTSHNIAVYSNGDKGALTSISSGQYSGLLMAGDNDEGLSISGGIFDDMPEPAYCAENYIPTDNTDEATKEAYPYTVKVGQYVAEINGTMYETLQEAWENVQDGETITLLADCSGNGIKAPQGKFTNGVTIDFDGHTYTMDGDMVGSSGTETQAFQLLKDNKITFKNGTIYSEKAKMLVQNYSDLTLEGMTLTLDNVNYTEAYTLSNNNGNVVIDGTTINANPAGGFAFDVCRYSSYPSVSVIVKSTSEINGDIQVDAGSGDPKDGMFLTVEGGTINGDLILTDGGASAITNNAEKAVVKKNNDVTLAAPQDYKWVDNGDGTSTLAPCVYVAQIGDDKYESLAAAVAAVPADGTETTITMIANEMINVVGSAVTIPATKNVVLDLNGFQVVGTATGGSTSALITNKGSLTIKDSSDTNKDGTGTGQLISGATNTWIYEGDGNYAGSYASNTITNSGTLTIESGYIENLSTGSATYAVDNNSSGADAILNVNGGLLKAHSVAVRQFANSTTLKNEVNIAGGTVTAGYSGIWIQLPGSDATKAMKASLNVTGGTLSGGSYAFYDYSYGNSFDATQYNLDGGTFDGTIFSFGANIAITDGTYKGEVAVKQTEPSVVTVSGGKFSDDVYTYGANASEGFITGGVFAINTYEYEGNTYDCDWLNLLADGYVVSDNTDPETKDAYPYAVRQANYICAIGTTKYETLADAVAAAGTAETTITLLTEAATDGVISGDGVVVPTGSNITFDLNGLTYDVSGETVGSSGTESNGFQLLQGSDITFKNGTLKATSPTAQMLIQNYSNLTLEDVNLDGTTLSGWAYALSNNCGTINLTGSTSITAKTGGRAFDTCKYASYAIPTVNINTTGAISGPIEATGGKLNIENGKFDVTWVTDANYTAGDIQITGGVFSAEPAEEYCADGYVTTDNEDAETKDAYPYAVMSKEDAGIFELIDGEIYPYLHYTEDKVAASVTYKRNFTNKNWQALFVPFDINDVAELTDRYEFAKIHMVALENDGTFTTGDKIEIYYTRVTSGKLSANQPYLIKAKNTGWQDIVVENTILKDTHNMPQRRTSTMAADYVFTGTYEGFSGLGTTKYEFLAMGGGTINWGGKDTKLGTYRWYIKPEPYDDDYAKPSFSFIEIDEEATGISAASTADNAEIEGYYTVNGVRSDVPVKGMNIVKYKNGKTKKIMIK